MHTSVYTTRPDTLMGVTFLAIASGHPLAVKAAMGDAGVRAFIETCEHDLMTEAAGNSR